MKEKKYTEIMIEFAKINAKLDKVLGLLQANNTQQESKIVYSDKPYALSSGSLVDGGTQQIWNKGKLVDCVSTTYIPSGDLSLE